MSSRRVSSFRQRACPCSLHDVSLVAKGVLKAAPSVVFNGSQLPMNGIPKRKRMSYSGIDIILCQVGDSWGSSRLTKYHSFIHESAL